MKKERYKAIIESILFTMGNSVELGQIADAIELSPQETRQLIEELSMEYEKKERGMRIMELDGS